MLDLGPDSARIVMPGAGTPRSGVSRATHARRILAVVLPDLISEIVEQQVEIERRMIAAATQSRTPEHSFSVEQAAMDRSRVLHMPVAVVLDDDVESTEPQRMSELEISALEQDAVICAANVTAQSLGVYRGQRLQQASNSLSRLQAFRLSPRALVDVLARLVDVVWRYGARVSYEAPDTIWLDVSSAAHESGGEAAVAAEVLRAITARGHYARVATGDGPWLAQAFARFADVDSSGARLVPSSDTTETLLGLPIIALPLEPETRAHLTRGGALTIGDLRAMSSPALVEQLLVQLPEPSTPRRTTSKRLRARSSSKPGRRGTIDVLELVRGRDRRVLEPGPAAALAEGIRWSHGISDGQAIDVALNAVCGRLAARLAGRLVAATELCLTASEATDPGKQWISIRLRTPLWSGEDLLRVVHTRARELVAGAAWSGVKLEAVQVAPLRATQTCLVFDEGGDTAPEPGALTRLLEQLTERVGPSALGFSTKLRHARGRSGDSMGTRDQRLPTLSHPTGRTWSQGVPTRWFETAVRLGNDLRKGQIVVLESQAYVICARHFEGRCTVRDGVRNVSRDYYRIWLSILDESPLAASPSIPELRFDATPRGVEALAFRDPGGARLQALFD